MGGWAAIIFQKPVEESSGGVEVVNPIWGTNRCLPGHTSTKTLGRQTAPVYLYLPQLLAVGPGQTRREGGGEGGKGGGLEVASIQLCPRAPPEYGQGAPPGDTWGAEGTSTSASEGNAALGH